MMPWELLVDCCGLDESGDGRGAVSFATPLAASSALLLDGVDVAVLLDTVFVFSKKISQCRTWI